MAKQKLFLTFDESARNRPIISSLTAEFGLVFNILGATVEAEKQFIALEIEGKAEKIAAALESLRESEVEVDLGND